MALKIAAATAAAFDTAATAAVDDAFATALGTNAVVEIRTGAKPSTPETAASGTLLASATIASWTPGSPGAGQVTGSNPGAVTADNSGVAGHFRIKTSGGTAIVDGDIGEGSGDLSLDETTIVAGGSVDLGAPVLTVPVTAAVA